MRCCVGWWGGRTPASATGSGRRSRRWSTTAAGAGRAAHRVGQVGRLLRRHRAAPGAGAGPTLIVSPLLALMRDQVAAAERAGVRAVTINSCNAEEWGDDRRARCAAGEVDVLLVSPERLNNPRFRDEQLPDLGRALRAAGRRRGALHQRLGPRLPARLPPHPRPADRLPAGTPGAGDDRDRQRPRRRRRRRAARRRRPARAHLRGGARPREPAPRRAAPADAPSSGSAWLADHLGDLPGSGIVYTLTVAGRRGPRALLRDAGLRRRRLHRPHRPRRAAGRRGRAAAQRVKALVATQRARHGLRQARPRLRRPRRRAVLADRLLPAGRPSRPRHRARRRAAAARPRGPRHLALLRVRVDARAQEQVRAVLAALAEPATADVDRRAGVGGRRCAAPGSR